MRRIIIVLSFLCCTSAKAQIDKVEHFYVSSAHAEKHFHFFKDAFHLPVVWDYLPWGNFSSGGLTLGNAVIEFVKSEHSTQTGFAGIGLQPHGSAENTIATLNAANVIHDDIIPFIFTLDNGAKDTAWEIAHVKNMLPENVDFLFCDYKHRKEIQKGRDDASDSLSLLNGGPLGIMGVQAIVIGCKNVAVCSNELAKLPGIKRAENNLFQFDSGPAIQLMSSDNDGIDKIVVKVSSLNKARQYLQSNNLLGTATNNSLYINSEAIEGLKIQLLDK
jgi:hypothetical protein